MALVYYLTKNKKGKGVKVSEFYWESIRPLTVRDKKETTKFLFNVIPHPTRDEEAIVVDDEAPWNTFVINPNNTDDEIADRTQELRNQGLITAAEKTALRAGIKASKGRPVTIKDLLPPRYLSPEFKKTQAEMEADGWFGDADINEITPVNGNKTTTKKEKTRSNKNAQKTSKKK